MKKVLYTILLITLLLTCWFNRSFANSMKKMNDIQTIDDVKALFPQSVQGIEQSSLEAINEAKNRLDAIISIPVDQRTFSNTFGAFDEAVACFVPVGNALETLKMVSTNADIRNAANTALVTLKNFTVDCFSQNNDLYNACKEYIEDGKKEMLNDEEQLYIKKVMKGFSYAGLHLSAERQAKTKALNKQLIPLEEQFMDNISSDQPFIKVSRAELAGLDDLFIEGLSRADDGLYILTSDYPTVIPILGNCTVESTRRNIWKIYLNRAYPQNALLLKQIIELRDELATTLGFESYAHLNLDDLMAKSPEAVDAFLDDIIMKSQPKVKQEVDLLLASLPLGVRITDDGKMFPWDVAFIKESYKKQHLNINERVIAEYFPLEHTLDQLLSIYEQFMGVSFKTITTSGLWHEEVKVVSVYNAEQELLGYLLLDLFPRPFKYTHACEIDIIKAQKIGDKHHPAVAVVLANFSRPTATQPALLQRNEVSTFFHEFGHALHEVLGATQLAAFAGTSVKRDFVEMPSQMLEEWLWDKEVLRKVSRHYVTGEPLPDDLIERIRALKTFDGGDWAQRQAFLAKLSLYYFKARGKKSLYDIHQDLHKEIRQHILWESEDHFEASFGHLIGYGAGYYSYLWAKVFALDLAGTIKKFGFMNPIIGKRYVDEILSKGGSVEPDILLKNFLGRTPNSEAFFQDMGIA